MATLITTTESQTYIDPYNAKLFDLNITDSRVYLSRQVNNLLKIFGNNVITQGLTENNLSIVSNDLIIEISEGTAIVDTTLHVFTETTTFEVDLTPYTEDGYWIISINYKYVQSIAANRPYFKLTHISNTGTSYDVPSDTYTVNTGSATIGPDVWNVNRDNLILAAYDYDATGKTLTQISTGATFIIDSAIYRVGGRPDLNANYLASLPIQQDLSPLDGGVLTWNDTVGEWQSRAQEPGFVVKDTEPDTTPPSGITIGNVWMVDYNDGSPWQSPDPFFNYRNKTLKLIDIDIGNGSINGNTVESVSLDGVWIEIPFALRDLILHPTVSEIERTRVDIASAYQINPADGSLIGLVIDKQISPFAGATIDFVAGTITNYDQGSGEVISNFAPYVPGTPGNWFKYGIILDSQNHIVLSAPISDAATKDLATNPVLSGGIPVSVIAFESQTPNYPANEILEIDALFDHVDDITNNWSIVGVPDVTLSLNDPHMRVTADVNNPVDIVYHNATVLTSTSTAYLFEAIIDNTTNSGDIIIRAGTTFNDSSSSDYDLVSPIVCPAGEITTIYKDFTSPSSGSTYISLVVDELLNTEYIDITDVKMNVSPTYPIKDIDDINMVRFAASGSNGNDSEEDFTFEDYLYSSLLDSSFYSNCYKDTFVDTSTVEIFNAVHIVANNSYAVSNANGYIFEKLIDDNSFTINKILLHIEGNAEVLANMTFQYSLSTDDVDPEFGAFSWSSEIAASELDTSVPLSGVTNDLWLKINFKHIDAELYSFGILYGIDNTIASSQVRLFELLTIAGYTSGDHTQEIPNGGIYTEDGRSASIYNTTGNRLTEGIDYNEVAGGRDIEFLNPPITTLTNGDKFLIIEFFGYVDASWENYYRINSEHSVNGEHILKDQTDGNLYKFVLNNGVLTYELYTPQTLQTPFPPAIPIQTTEVVEMNDRIDAIEVNQAAPVIDSFTPTLGQTVFTLSDTPINPDGFDLFLNGERRLRGTDFTQSGTALTWLDPLGETLVTTDTLIARYGNAGSSANVLSVHGRQGDVVGVLSDYDASQVDNDSGVAGATVKDALDNISVAIAPIDSVFARTGDVVSAVSDYDASQVDNDSAVTGATVKDALEQLDSEIVVDSVHGRSGAVIAAASDYDASQVDNDSAVTGTFVKDALDNLDIWDDDTVDITPVNAGRNVDIGTGLLKDNDVSAGVALGDSNNTTLHSSFTATSVIGAINETKLIETVVSKSFGDSPYSAVIGDNAIAVNTSAGRVIIELPSTAGNTGARIRVAKLTSDLNQVTINPVGAVSEVATITTDADSSDSLHGLYWLLDSINVSYYIWYNTSGTPGSGDPAVIGKHSIEVAIVTNDTANAVATATHNTINAKADFISINTTPGELTVTNFIAGSVSDAANFNISPIGTWSWTTNIQGVDSIDTVGFQPNWSLSSQGDGLTAIASGSNGWILFTERHSTGSKFFSVDGGSSVGDHRVANIASASNFNFEFRVPADFLSIIKLVLILSPSSGADDPGQEIEISSDYGTMGEVINIHSESDLTSVYDFTGLAGVFIELDISSIYTNISALDICGLFVNHPAPGVGVGGINYYGISLEYIKKG